MQEVLDISKIHDHVIQTYLKKYYQLVKKVIKDKKQLEVLTNQFRLLIDQINQFEIRTLNSITEIEMPIWTFDLSKIKEIIDNLEFKSKEDFTQKLITKFDLLIQDLTKITFANKYIIELFEAKNIRKLQKNFMKLFQLKETKEKVLEFLFDIYHKEFYSKEVSLISFKENIKQVMSICYISERYQKNWKFVHLIFIDITEQKKLQLMLNEERLCLNRLFDASPDGISLFDSNLNFLAVNKQGALYLNKDESEIIGRNLRELIPNIEQSGRIEKYLEVIKTGKSIVIEDIKGDETLNLEYYTSKAFPVGDGMGLIATNITDLKKIEQQLYESKEHYRSLFDEAPIGIWELDLSDTKLFLNNLKKKVKDIPSYLLKNSEKLSDIIKTTKALKANKKGLKQFNYPIDSGIDLTEFNHQALSALDSSFIIEVISKLLKGNTFFRVELEALIEDQEKHYILEYIIPKPFQDDWSRVLMSSFDLTKQMVAEKKLDEEQNRLNSLFDATPDSIGLFDSDLNIININKKGARLLGKTPEELIGTNIADHIPGIKESGRYDQYLKVIKTGQTLTFTNIPAPDSVSIEYYNTTAFKVGEGMGLIVTNVTELQKAQNELLKSREQYKSLVEKAPIGIWELDYSEAKVFIDNLDVKDVDELEELLLENEELYFKFIRLTKPISANNLGLEHFNYPGNGLSIEDFYYEACFQLQKSDIIVVAKNIYRNNYSFQINYYVKIDDFRKVFTLSYGVPESNRADWSRIIVSSFDITERTQIEDFLETEKERLNMIIRSIGEGVIVVDKKGKIIIFNQMMEQLSGWKHYEAIGKQLDKVIKIVDVKRTDPEVFNLHKILTQNKVDSYIKERVLQLKSGKEKEVSIIANRIKGARDENLGLVIIIRDITFQKRNEQELLKTQKLESIGFLAGGIAHDFNNILSAMLTNISYTQFLLESETDKEKITNRLAEIEKAIQRAKSLTTQLLVFSKGGEPVKKVTSLEELLRSTTEFTLSGTNVESIYTIAKNLHPVIIDKSQINQVINNIIVNAIEMMPDGGKIEIEAKNVIIKESFYIPLEDGNYVKVSIRDSGPGIPDDILPKIFDPYFTTKETGSGLGLAVAHSIVKNHGGIIEVDTSLGNGSTFHIYLPAVIKPKPVEKKVIKTELTKGTGKILLMDDEEVILEVVSLALTHLGFEVVTTKEGKSAIEKYRLEKEKGEPFDVLIFDLTIPNGLGGKEALEEILIYDPKVKAIVSSGYSDAPVMANYKDYGFVGVLKKPYDLNELKSLLDIILRI